MKMKAALASSLAYRPRLLILDEPFSGLDPFVRDEFIRGMLEISEQASWTVFISSHDVDEVERLADWVGFINEGTMAFSEANESLQNRFRKMEFNVSKGIAHLPDGLPSHWFRPEVSGLKIKFITGQYQPQQTETVIQQYFPEASSIIASTLSLREIFITLSSSL
jgi:ABC-2 type transport system ATP-binding protein